MKIAYVILHYMAWKDTIECAESILNATKESESDTIVVIVDNGSTNDSYSEIQRAFTDNEKVIVLHSDENLGFARGNNIGFRYAKQQFQADFIALLNNDTILTQSDFNEIVVRKYDEYQWAVLGPDIVTLDGCHQNPGRVVDWSLKKLFLFRQKKRVQYWLAHFNAFDKYLTLNEGSFQKEKVMGDELNVQLHGACLIFSKLYIDKFDGLYDGTFLYMEEDILKLRSDYYGYRMVYSPDLTIIHKEDIATNMISEKSIEKKKRIYKNLLHSAKVYSNLKKQYTSNNPIRTIIEKTAQRFKGEEYMIDKEIPLSYLIGLMLQRVFMLARGYRKQGIDLSKKKFFCGKRVYLRCKKKLTLNNGVTLQDNVYIDALSKDGVYLGVGSSIGAGTVVRCSGNIKEIGKGFRLGDYSSLGDNCFVGATGGVWVGNDVIGGQNIRFHASNHVFKDTEVLIRKQGITATGIFIGNNCWIGAGVIFCDGITVGNGCVIGANSVVTKSFPDDSIIAGSPAKVIGRRRNN